MAPSYGDQVKLWVQNLFVVLIDYAQGRLEVDDHLKSKIKVDCKAANELVFRTELRFLKQLAQKHQVKTSRGSISEDNIRDALRCYFKDYLGILKDNRENEGKGSKFWHFTLILWSSDQQENLKQFNLVWEQRRFPNAQVAVPTSIDTDSQPLHQIRRSHPYCNLPARTYPQFIGRETQLKQLLKYMSLDYRAPIITVDGIGGVGKTALVLEAAYQCWQANLSGNSTLNPPLFDAIIFTSAKESYLLPTGLVPQLQRRSTLGDIFRVIALTLDEPTITQATASEQLHLVYASLSKQRTLLIVDNMETLADKQEVIAFLNDLPMTAKAVITTREYIPLYSFIRLDCLSEVESIRLIQQQAQEKVITLHLEECKALNRRFGGVPVALIYAIGQLASGYSLEMVLDATTGLTDDIALFCFDASVQPLQGQPAHKLLMALALFPEPPMIEAIAAVAGLQTDSIAVNKGWARLQQLSLVRQQAERYTMLALTREYVVGELTKNKEFAEAAKERWVQWYLQFAKKYGVEEWTDWHLQYEHLNAEWGNLLTILQWCAVQGRYKEIKELWKYLDDCAYVYGYWEDRSFWLSWLVQTAEERGDWRTFVEVVASRGWPLTLMLCPERMQVAAAIYAKAWELREEVEIDVQAYLAENIAQLKIRYQQCVEARYWLKIKEELLQQSSLWNEVERDRHQVNLLNLMGKICHLEKESQQAKCFYEQALLLAKNSEYQRAVNFIQNQLANIAIELGNLEEAEKLLQVYLPIIVRNKNRRRLASYYHSLTRLAIAQGKVLQAQEYAAVAVEVYEQLGMEKQVNEVKSLFQEQG